MKLSEREAPMVCPRTDSYMRLFIFARFHACAGYEATVAAALRDVTAATRRETGCLAIDAFRSARDPGLFYVHSCWTDEAAFELHAKQPHTLAFLARVEPLIDHALEVTRTLPLE
ncbi:MAG TPA: putative quinol monooxygenase [Rhizomicrobium sp.]